MAALHEKNHEAMKEKCTVSSHYVYNDKLLGESKQIKDESHESLAVTTVHKLETH